MVLDELARSVGLEAARAFERFIRAQGREQAAFAGNVTTLGSAGQCGAVHGARVARWLSTGGGRRATTDDPRARA